MHNKTYLSNLDKSKLDKFKEVELAEAKKIQLSLTDDAKEVLKLQIQVNKYLETARKNSEASIDKLQETRQDARVELDMITEGIKTGDDYTIEAESILKELEKGADALGLDANDIPIYKQLLTETDELYKSLNASQSVRNNLNDLI